MPLDVNTFAEKIKTKYPQYKDVDNLELAKKIVEKYPQYKEQVTFEEVKKKETTESSLEDGSSVMPEQETQEPSEFYIYKHKPNARYKKEGNKWYIDPNSSGKFKEITSTDRVSELNKNAVRTGDTRDYETRVWDAYYTKFDENWADEMNYRFKKDGFYFEKPNAEGKVLAKYSPDGGNTFTSTIEFTPDNFGHDMFIGFMEDSKQKKEQEPSESSTSKIKVEEGLYSGYPGKEGKKYRFDETSNSWFEYSHTDASDKGNIDVYDKPISDVSRVTSLNKFFNKQASTSDVTQVFTGYPGKEKNEYTIIDGKWHRRMPGKSEFSEVKNVGSIQALNREFGQDVGAVTDEVGQKKQQEKEQLDIKLNSVDGNLVDLEEEDAVVKLREMFPDFKFEESGALTDNVKVIAPYGVDEITLPFDNFSSSADSDVAKQLKSFLNTYSNKDLVEKMAKEQAASMERAGDLTWSSPDDYMRGDRDSKAFLSGIKVQKAREELTDEYNNAFIKLKLNKNTTAEQLSTLPKNESVVRSIESNNASLQGKMNDYNVSVEDFNKISESLSDEEYNERLEDLKIKSNEIKDEIQKSTVASKALGEAILNNSLIREEQGNFGSGMARNFVSGLTSLDRLFGLSPEEHQQLLDDIVGVGTTKEYIQSEKRSDLVKAMFSVSESLGVAAPGLLTGGGSIVTGGLFFNQSYHEMKDELDQIEGMDGTDKMLMSTAYGLVSAALENFGLGVALNKTKVGNALTKTALSRFLKEIPLNATKETIEQVLRKTTGEFVADLTTRGLKSSLAEGTTEALQYLSGEGVKELYDIAKDKDLFKHEDLLKQTWENFYIGALAGGITSATNTSLEHATKFGVNKLEDRQMATIMRELKEPSALREKKAFVNEQLKQGLITQEEAKATIDKYDAMHNALNTLPDDIKPKKAREALGLMAERKKLEKEIEGKEEMLVVPQKERIKEINDKLVELSKTKEEDAVQEQTTDEGVLRQEESEVGLQEVEQRDQEQEVVAEEGEEVTTELTDADIKTSVWSTTDGWSEIKRERELDNLEGVGTDTRFTHEVKSQEVNDGRNTLVHISIPGRDKFGRIGGTKFSFMLPKGTTVTPEQIFDKVNEINESVKLTAHNVDIDTFKDNVNKIEAEVKSFIIQENNKNIQAKQTEATKLTDQSILQKSKEETFETLKSLDTKDKTNLQKVQSWLNKMDEDLDNFGKETLGVNIPVAVAKVVVKTVKTLVDAGVSLEQAIKQAAKDNNISETDVVEAFDKVNNKVNETQASKAAKGISKKPTKKTTVNERTALRDQIKYAQKIAREIAKNTKEGQEAVRAHINERLKGLKATFNKTQFERAMKRAMKTRFYDAHDVARLNEYIDKTAKKAENFDKIKSALSLKSKIRKRLKNNQKDTKIAAKKFGAIDPIMVEDIDKYIAIAEKVYNAVKPTVLGAKRQDYKTATELDEVMAYAEAEVARQDEIRKQNLLASDKGQLLLMDGIISEDMSLKEIQDAMKEKSEELDEDFMQEIKDITSDMQDRVKEMEDVSEDISDMANMDLESLSKKELVTLYEYLDNFLVNQTEDGTALFNRFIKGKNNASRAAKSGLRFKKINKISRTYRMLLSNQESLLDRLLGSSTKSELFKSLSGLLDFDKAKYAAQKLHDSILKEYDSKFSKVKDFKSTKNIFERGIYAYLSRNSEVDFEARKQNVLDTIENLKNSKREHEMELAEKYEKDITRMGVRDAKSLSDLNVAEHNKQAVEFWQQKWSEYYGDLKYIASTIYNKDLNEDQNYTPDFYKKLDVDEKAAEQLMESGNFGDLSKISTEMPGVLMDAKTPNGLKNMYVDFDFDHNIANQMESALKSIYADKHVATVKSFLESKDFSELFEDNDLRDVVKWMLDDYVNRSMKRSSQRSTDKTIRKIQSLDRKTAAVFNMLGLAGTAQALASVTQYAKNTIPIIANTYVNLGKNARYLDFVLNKWERDFIDNLDYPISIRGKEAVTGLYKEMGYEKADTPKRVRAVNKISEKALQATIGISDKYVARVSWMAYYKANLAEQGVKVGDIDWSTHKVNDKAASYAQSMVDRQQNISDIDKRSVIDRTAFSTIANVIQPFSSFILSAKMRMRNDVNTLIRSRRSGDISEKEVREAKLSLLGTLAEIATFQAISLGVSETYNLIARSFTGEPEEEDKNLASKLSKRIMSQTILDAVSPTPMADEFTSLIFNLLSDGINHQITSDKKVNEYIRAKQNEEYEKHASESNIYKYTFTELEKKELREKYFEENKFNINIYKNDSELLSSLKYLGKTAIPIGKIADVVESISLKSKKEFKDDLFGNKKYIPDEAEYLLNEAMALSVLGLISPDASAIGRRIGRTIKRYSLTKAQYERYSVAKSYAPGSFSLEDLYLIKNTNLTPDKIANYAIENQGKDKIKIYKRYKKEGVF